MMVTERVFRDLELARSGWHIPESSFTVSFQCPGIALLFNIAKLFLLNGNWQNWNAASTVFAADLST
ncbi:MAG: hypothetical protein ACKVZH_12680 [Blastocatellia bacterium]